MAQVESEMRFLAEIERAQHEHTYNAGMAEGMEVMSETLDGDSAFDEGVAIEASRGMAQRAMELEELTESGPRARMAEAADDGEREWILRMLSEERASAERVEAMAVIAGAEHGLTERAIATATGRSRGWVRARIAERREGDS